MVVPLASTAARFFDQASIPTSISYTSVFSSSFIFSCPYTPSYSESLACPRSSKSGAMFVFPTPIVVNIFAQCGEGGKSTQVISGLFRKPVQGRQIISNWSSRYCAHLSDIHKLHRPYHDQ
ncbi:Protein of unknown function [Pyronema omphalodes CBS 100304]|uniref:Uncharacterized protein n=1 Tax=Pyronema omphalodes (strain CBS 100304) TaxID=1076935 RepID=U4LJS2_PYROM|nr:Protein of unknown function [Pyronema omphalodes CBS 100304]